MIVFGIHRNIFIVLPIRLKTSRSNDFLFFSGQKVLARKIMRVSEVLRTRYRHRVHNLFRPVRPMK